MEIIETGGERESEIEVIRGRNERVIETGESTAEVHHHHHHKHTHKNGYVEPEQQRMATEIIDAGGGMGGAGLGLGAGLGGGLLGGILAGALFGNRGGLFGGNGEGSAAVGLQSSIDTNTILQSLGDIKASVPLAESQVQLALAGQAASLTNQINSSSMALLLGQGDIRANLSLQTQNLTEQIAAVGNQADRNLFQLSQTIVADGAQTRALIQSIDKQNDSRLITAQANEIIELRAEQNRSSDRHGIEINMINNQNQNQMQFQQQAQVLNTLANALVEVGQIARATNSNVIVGNTGASTTGAQTASPTNVRA